MKGDAQVGGDLTLAAGGTNKLWSQYFGAQEVFNISAGTLINVVFQVGDVLVSVIDFDKDATEAACLTVGLPADYDGSALKFTFYWTATAGTTGGVNWNLILRVFDDGESLATVTSGQSVTDTFQGTNLLHAADLTATPEGAASGDLLSIYLRRITTSGGDTFDADARFIGMRISYA